MLLDPELHYLDNAATTMVDPEIAGAIHEALLKDWANPSSLYEPAVETHEALTTARGQIARTLGCQAKDLYFTSCGSESNNLAVQGLAMARKNWGSKIVVSGFEHPSVQRPIRALKDRGFEVVEILPEADGHLDVAKLAARWIKIPFWSVAWRSIMKPALCRILPLFPQPSRPKTAAVRCMWTPCRHGCASPLT